MPANDLFDKSSPYYYGTDSVYKPTKSKQAVKPNTQPQFEIGLDGVPRLVKPAVSLPVDLKRTELLTRGDTTRNFGANYAAEELAAGQKAEDYRKGAGFVGQTPTKSPPDPDPDPDGIETSPNKGNMPMSWAEYESWLGSKGIQMRGGYQSTALPGLATSQFDGKNVDFESQTWKQASDDAKAGFKKGAEELGLETKSVPAGPQYGNTAMSQTDYFNTGEEQAGGAQEGMASAADVGDQSRALRIPKGARQREMFFRDNPNYGQEDNTPEPMTSGLSVRSRAFLDAPMDVGAMGVMRRTNAAQGIMRQGDKIVHKGTDGTIHNLTQEGYDDIRQNQRNAQTFKEDFLREYVPATSAEAQNPDAISPVPASFSLNAEKFVETDLITTPISTEKFGEIMDSYQGMDLQAENLTNQVLGNDREPLMREDLLSKLASN